MTDTYKHLQIKKPYIALNTEMYINIRKQELATCNKIGYEFYCKEFLKLDINLNIVAKVQFTLT